MKFAVAYLLIFLTFQSSSQITEFSGIYWQNLTQVNPAMSGLEFKHHATVSYYRRVQNDYTLNTFVDYNTRICNYHGVGLNYSYNESSPWQSHLANFNYNYQWMLKNGAQLSTGVAAGIQKASVHPLFESLSNQSDSLHSIITPNVTIGFAYRARYWLFGLSFASLQRPIEEDENALNLVPSRNANLHASYTLRITRKMSLRSRLLVQSDFKIASMNIGTTLVYKDFATVGLGYRTNNTFYSTIGCTLYRRIKLGYSLEYTSRALSMAAGFNHQIVLDFYIQNKGGR